MATRSTVPDDLTVLDNGVIFADEEDRMEYLWFHLLEREGGRQYTTWRAVTLRVLRYLPQEARLEPGLVERMRTVLSGLYNQRRAQYDLVELKAAIFDPPLGVMQLYGAVGLADDRDSAVRNALFGLAALQGAMANFEQSRLEPLTVQLAEWMRRALAEFPHTLVVIGQPEPRMGARGMGREGPGEMKQAGGQAGGGQQSTFTQQQAENLCRAMASAQEEFLSATLASRLPPNDLARMLAGVAAEASVPASQVTGSESISAGIAIPIALSESLGQNVATAFGKQQGQAVSDGVAQSDTVSHMEGHATTVGRAVTDGTAHTVGTATTAGGSQSTSLTVTDGTAHTDGSAHTDGAAHTQGRATSVGSFSSSGVASGSSWGHSDGQSQGTSMPGGTETKTTPGGSQTTTNYGDGGGILAAARDAVRDTPGEQGDGPVDWGRVNDAVDQHVAGGGYAAVSVSPPSASVNGSVRVNVLVASGGGGASATTPLGPSVSIPTGQVVSTQTPLGPTVATARPLGPTTSEGTSSSDSYGGSYVVSASSGSSSSTTNSTGDTNSQADTASQANTASHSVSRGVSYGSFSSTTHSSSDTTSHAETASWASTTSTADGTAHGTSQSHGVARSSGTGISRSLGLMHGSGIGMAAVPSFGISRSYQWFNDQAAQLTQILRAQEELLRQATLEGAWQTDVYLLTRTERGAAVAEAAVRQAFHGSGPLVVTPVQTRLLSDAEQRYVRLHAMAFTPSTREETIAGALEAYKDSTLLLPLQLAAYTSPVLFEEGMSVTTQERMPAFAFVPDMPGDVVLGHLWSTERAALTAAPLRLSPDRFFHTVFAGDTGSGKTVAAERLVVETTKMWHYRTVVLDFGAGWRRLLNAHLGEPGRVEVLQLFPGAPVPFRWNPWQVGRRIQPDRQLLSTCEIFKNAGRMGPRQLGFMRRAARELYLDHGVLTSDREVLASTTWNRVRDAAEADAVTVARRERGLPSKNPLGAHLEDLDGPDRQALAVYRSKVVDMSAWVDRLVSYKPELEKKRDQASLQSLEGVILRLEVFTQGEMARMYGSGEGTVSVEDLGLLGPASNPWGISVLEGGAELDEYAKASILGLVAWHLYNDAVVRRRQDIGKQGGPVLQIVFEEANKVLSGVETDSSQEKGGGATTTDQFQTMWRDGRKYRIFLHPVVQTVSELPPGILSSCNNGFFGQTKNPKDRDLTMAHLAYSEKGFTDEDWKRFLSRMPAAMAIVKLGYSQDVLHTTPFLVRPAMVAAPEPTDEEILAHFRAMRGARGRA